jgi:hypothetical protein
MIGKKFLENVGSSVMFTVKDVVAKRLFPNTSSAIRNNADFVKDSLNILKDTNRVRDSIGKSMDNEVLKQMKLAKANALEDLKSGNWNNQARQDKAIAKAMGFDESMLDFGADGGSGEDGSMFSGDSDHSSNTTTSKSKTPSGGTFQNRQTTNNVNSIKQVMVTRVVKQKEDVGTHGRLNKIAAIHIATAEANSRAIGGVQDVLAQIQNFNIEHVVTFHKTSADYYTNSAAHLDKIEKAIIMMADFQTGKMSQKAQRAALDGANDIMDSASGFFDLAKYKDYVLKRVKGDYGDMYDTVVRMGLAPLAANPVGTVLDTMLNMIIPQDFKKKAEEFDKVIGNLAPALLMGLNSKAKKDPDGFWGTVGKVMGLDIPMAEKMNHSKYNQGAVPFDGITKKAIVEVIPSLLSKILGALKGHSHEDEHVYDYDKGKFTTRGGARAGFEREKARQASQGFEDYRWKVLQQIHQQNGGMIPAGMHQKVNESFLKLAHGNERLDAESIGRLLKHDPKLAATFSGAFHKMSLGEQMQANANVMDARNSVNNFVNKHQGSDHSVLRQAGAFDQATAKLQDHHGPVGGVGGPEGIRVFVTGGHLDSWGGKKGKGGRGRGPRGGPGGILPGGPDLGGSFEEEEAAKQAFETYHLSKMNAGERALHVLSGKRIGTDAGFTAEAAATQHQNYFQKKLAPHTAKLHKHLDAAIGHIGRLVNDENGSAQPEFAAMLGAPVTAPLAMLAHMIGVGKDGAPAGNGAVAGGPESKLPLMTRFSRTFERKVIDPMQMAVLGKDGAKIVNNVHMMEGFVPRLEKATSGIAEKTLEVFEGKPGADQDKNKGVWANIRDTFTEGPKQLWGETMDYLLGKKGADGKRDRTGVMSSAIDGINHEVKDLAKKAMTWFLGEKAVSDEGKSSREGGVMSGIMNKGYEMMDQAKAHVNKFLFGTGQENDEGLFGKAKGLFPWLKKGFENHMVHMGEVLFGKRNEEGKFEGGYVRALGKLFEDSVFKPLREHIASDWKATKHFFQIQVIDKLKDTLDPFIAEFKMQFKRLVKFGNELWGSAKNKMMGFLNFTFEKAFGKPFSVIMEKYLLKPLRGTLDAVKNVVGAVLRRTILLPVNMFKNASDRLRAKHQALKDAGVEHHELNYLTKHAEAKKETAHKIAEARKADPALDIAYKEYEEAKKSRGWLEKLYHHFTGEMTPALEEKIRRKEEKKLRKAAKKEYKNSLVIADKKAFELEEMARHEARLAVEARKGVAGAASFAGITSRQTAQNAEGMLKRNWKNLLSYTKETAGHLGWLKKGLMGLFSPLLLALGLLSGTVAGGLAALGQMLTDIKTALGWRPEGMKWPTVPRMPRIPRIPGVPELPKPPSLMKRIIARLPGGKTAIGMQESWSAAGGIRGAISRLPGARRVANAYNSIRGGITNVHELMQMSALYPGEMSGYLGGGRLGQVGSMALRGANMAKNFLGFGEGGMFPTFGRMARAGAGRMSGLGNGVISMLSRLPGFGLASGAMRGMGAIASKVAAPLQLAMMAWDLTHGDTKKLFGKDGSHASMLEKVSAGFGKAATFGGLTDWIPGLNKIWNERTLSSSMKTTGQDLYNAPGYLLDLFGKKIGGWEKWAVDQASAVGRGFHDAIQWAVDKVGGPEDWWKTLSDSISKKFEPLISGAKNLWGDVKQAFGETLDSFTKPVKWIFGGMWKGMKAAWDWVGDKFNGFTNSVGDAIVSFLPKSSQDAWDSIKADGKNTTGGTMGAAFMTGIEGGSELASEAYNWITGGTNSDVTGATPQGIPSAKPAKPAQVVTGTYNPNKSNTDSRTGTQDLSWFIAPQGVSYPVSSPWGAPREGKGPHQGWDFAVATGTQVLAQCDGKVVVGRKTGYNWDPHGTGNTVLILDANGKYHEYGHLSKILVSEGQGVHRGDLIALSGQSGLDGQAPPHLHYGIIDNDRGINKIPHSTNPSDYFNGKGRGLINGTGASEENGSGATASRQTSTTDDSGWSVGGGSPPTSNAPSPPAPTAASIGSGLLAAGALPSPVSNAGGGVDQWNPQIMAASKKYGVDPNIIKAIIMTESEGNPDSISGVGAAGLMQIMPDNWQIGAQGRGWALANKAVWRDPAKNINKGTSLLASYLKMFPGDLRSGITAYNAGPGNVQNGNAWKWKESSTYYGKVQAALGKLGAKVAGSGTFAGTGGDDGAGSSASANVAPSMDYMTAYKAGSWDGGASAPSSGPSAAVKSMSYSDATKAGSAAPSATAVSSVAESVQSATDTVTAAKAPSADPQSQMLAILMRIEQNTKSTATSAYGIERNTRKTAAQAPTPARTKVGDDAGGQDMYMKAMTGANQDIPVPLPAPTTPRKSPDMSTLNALATGSGR